MYAENLIFDENKYRTPIYHEALALLLNTVKGFSGNEKGQNQNKLTLSSQVAPTEIEPVSEVSPAPAGYSIHCIKGREIKRESNYSNCPASKAPKCRNINNCIAPKGTEPVSKVSPAPAGYSIH